jgi:hypothetical protein
MPADLLLASRYEQMAAAAARGVDADALRRETGNLRRRADGAVALPFSEPWKSIRLLAAPVRLPPSLGSAVERAQRAALACLSSTDKADVFSTPRDLLHVTLHHFGRPGDCRVATEEQLAQELEHARAVVGSTPAFSLTVDRLLLTDTGVLVLLYQTEDAGPLLLRERLMSAFGDSPQKQTTLLHSSLLRLLAVPAPEEVLLLRRSLEQTSREIRGAQVPFTSLWYVTERALPIEGDVVELPLSHA